MADIDLGAFEVSYLAKTMLGGPGAPGPATPTYSVTLSKPPRGGGPMILTQAVMTNLPEETGLAKTMLGKQYIVILREV